MFPHELAYPVDGAWAPLYVTTIGRHPFGPSEEAV